MVELVIYVVVREAGFYDTPVKWRWVVVPLHIHRVLLRTRDVGAVTPVKL
jgi:hypothetical protein